MKIQKKENPIIMKMFRKILATVIAVVIAISVFAVSASAVGTPTFKLKMTSQTSSEVTFELSLVSGSFNSFDVELKVSSPIGACKEINMTDEFKQIKNDLEDAGGIVTSAKNVNTVMISFASTKAVSEATTMYTFKFAKSSGNVSLSNYNTNFSSCVLTVDNENVEMVDKIQVIKGYIDFKQTSINANYKQSAKIDYDSNYSASEIKWESSNTEVATVDDNGNVKMTGRGSATITAKSSDGEVTATCSVNVSYAWWQWIIIIVLLGFLWY